MNDKQCFKCGEVKPLSAFYKHKGMADGHVNKCKECNKKDVRENRKARVDYYREYDRERGNRQTSEYLREWREKYPAKHRAHQMVRLAIKRGNLVPEPCESCGADKTHAHHDDYLKPLNVRWLCPACHKAWHDANGEGANSTVDPASWRDGGD